MSSRLQKTKEAGKESSDFHKIFQFQSTLKVPCESVHKEYKPHKCSICQTSFYKEIQFKQPCKRSS